MKNNEIEALLGLFIVRRLLGTPGSGTRGRASSLLLLAKLAELVELLLLLLV